MKNLPAPTWILALALACLTAAWIALRLPTAAQALLETDGGHQLAGALQILHGEHPFVDFEATYGPLTFYASALAQVVFGQRFIGEIILNVMGYALAYALLAVLIYRLTGKAWLALLFGALAVLLLPRLYKYYIVLGPVLTVWFAWEYIQKPRLRNIFWLALAVLFAGLFRSDFGVYCTLAATVVLALQPASTGWLRRVFTLWGLIFLMALPWLLFLAFRGGLDNYFGDMLVGGPNIASGMSLPFPTFQPDQPIFARHNLRVIATIFFFCFPSISLVFLLARWKFVDSKERALLLAATVLYALSLLQAANRVDYPHVVQTIPLAFLLAAWMANRLSQEGLWPFKSWDKLVYLGCLLGLGLSVAVFLYLERQSSWPAISLRDIPQKIQDYTLPKEALLGRASRGGNNWYVETMQYIRRCTSASQYLVALPALTTFPYFTDRSFGGGQIGLAPGYFSTPADQQRMIHKMQAQDIPLIVSLPDFAFDRMPERRLAATAPMVVAYLEANYREIKKEGPASLLLRRDLAVERRSGKLKDFSCPVP